MDASSFWRIAQKIRLTMIRFHIANFVIHILPCIITLATTVEVTPIHGVISVIAHFGWGVYATKGTLKMDQMYVEMKATHWYIMWIVVVLVEGFMVPFLF